MVDIQESVASLPTSETSLQLVPLFDKTGASSYWADPASSQIFDLTGQAIALFCFDSVFDRSGLAVNAGNVRF